MAKKKTTGEVHTYELFAGKSHVCPGGPGTEEILYKEGDKCETAMPLDEMWPDKWAKVGEDLPSPRLGRKSKKPAAASKVVKPEPADEAGETEDGADNVTDQFPAAVKNDLKVTHIVGEGYTIHDGDNVVNEEPLKTNVQVTKRLKEYTEGGQK